ncbi:MAG: hypothetical protein ACRDNB_12530 [Gaiellaceae bacterium]
MRTETTSERVGQDVVRWRREQLLRSSFAPPLAAEIAEDARYDLHALIELVERGCPPELAVRILSPEQGASAA